MEHMERVSKTTMQRFSDAKTLPDGAVILTEAEVTTIRWNMIDKWKPKTEMWSLLHGNLITGGIAALSGALLNYHYRQQFKLRTYGRWISYAPVVIIPFMTAAAFETIMVTLPIVSGQINCPLCAEIRYASLQVCFGFGQPWLLSILGSTALSKTFSTMAMPPDWPGIAVMHGRMLRRAQLPFVSLFALNIIAAMIVAQEQGKASLKLTTQVQMQMDG